MRSAPLLAKRQVALPPALSAAEVANHLFTPVRFQNGYNAEQVDDLLSRAVAALEDRALGRESTVALSGQDVRGSRFRATKFRPGYHQEEVDAFLEELALTLDLAADGAELAPPTADGRAFQTP